LSGVVGASPGEPATRLVVSIDNSAGGDLVDYQISATIPFTEGMEADFSDVRFRDTNGSTLLDFWIESYTESTSALVWVKVPSIGASSSKTIYAYYGDSEAEGGSDICATFVFGDDFNRTNLNPTWTKSASNPLTAAGYGDPGVFYESETFYIFVDNFSTGNIDLLTSSDGTTLSSQGSVLDKGSEGAWDDYFVRDPSIVKIGSTYHMWFAGQTDAEGGTTTHKIGHATAPAITGPWTKDASNPIIDRSGDGYGCNEPCVVYDPDDDGYEYKMLYTYGTFDKGDVGAENIGYAYSSDGSSFTLYGQVMDFGDMQDQFVVKEGKVYTCLVDNSSAAVLRTISKDFINWLATTTIGGIPEGGIGEYDHDGVYAPCVVLVDGTYYCYYQSADAGDHTISLATTTDPLNMANWVNYVANLFTISDNRMYKSLVSTGSWRSSKIGWGFDPPYIVECEIEFQYQDDGAYHAGISIGDISGYHVIVIFDVNSDVTAIALTQYPDYGSGGSSLGTSTDVSLSLSTVYKIRAIVTSSSVQVDLYDGSWHTNILSSEQSMLTGYPAGYGYNNDNEFFIDNFRIRKYASTEPSVEVS